MAQLFADEDFPCPVVEALRGLGHDVLTTVEAGLAGVGTDDSAILAEATRLGRVVLTMNRRDYIAMHLAGVAHAGIIACKKDDDVAAFARRIHDAIAAMPDVAGQLIRIVKPHPGHQP